MGICALVRLRPAYQIFLILRFVLLVPIIEFDRDLSASALDRRMNVCLPVTHIQLETTQLACLRLKGFVN